MIKRLALILAVLISLSLAHAAQAVTIDAGSYVKLGDVALFGTDSNTGQLTGVDWSFIGGLGTCGPFLVSSPDPSWPERLVQISAGPYSAVPGMNLDLMGAPASGFSFIPASLQFAYATSYTVSQMRFDLLLLYPNGNVIKLYSETRSGSHGSGPTVVLNGRYNPAVDSLVFRVTVVPEPSPLLTLPVLLSGLLLRKRRRR